MPRTRLGFFALAWAATFGPGLRAEDPKAFDARVGMLVVTKAPRISLRLGEQDAGKTNAQVVYRVTRVDGRRFWVEAGKVSGWVQADDVVPLDEAVDYFSEEIRKHPRTAWLYQMRALAHFEKKDYDRAISDDLEALQIEPNDAASYHNLGDAWLQKREYDQAIKDYNEATRLDPRDASAYYHRAMAWSAKKDYSLAIADFHEAIRLDPNDAEMYRNRALAWSAEREFGAALADFEKAIKLDPRDAPSYNGRGWILATSPDPQLRDGKRAVASAIRGCELTGWRQPYYLGTLAAAYAEIGDFASAEKWQRKALARFPKDDRDQNGHRRRLALYEAKKVYRDEAPKADR